ncbi:hypothetical protein [Pelagicoccus sp. SDUM812003]|uniref:hypothetical protein n=1 Tax=Pelagicoccus sp. SDUM812003 TaxID=3041267 RepID=UPI00280C4925|nr:hypothetical protein [Pelagicoccus sp. SDUM812003]MDQ8202796.1 hypothetical protein [Pelagicoccus sp. SDUM812003]
MDKASHTETNSNEMPTQGSQQEWETPVLIELSIDKTAGLPGDGVDGGAGGDSRS